MTPQEEFIEIYNKYITRQGADELLEWLKRTDFFTAPASSKYHCACENGLVMHSVSVFNTMMEMIRSLSHLSMIMYGLVRYMNLLSLLITGASLYGLHWG